MSRSLVLNFVSFQALWFSCVVGGGGHGMVWLALASLVPISILTWYSPTRSADAIIALLALAAGLIIDNIWVVLGILDYPHNTFAPYWIAFLWVGLGLTVNHSMALFRDHTLVGSLVVGIAAPVTYLAGERFGAVVVADLSATPLISIVWFLTFYALSKFSLWMISNDGGETAS